MIFSLGNEVFAALAALPPSTDALHGPGGGMFDE
jgi:hypothetical protein